MRSPVFPFAEPLNIDIGRSDTEELTARKQNWPMLISYFSLSLFLAHTVFRSFYTHKKNNIACIITSNVRMFYVLSLCDGVAVLYRFLAERSFSFWLVFVAVVVSNEF